MLERLRRPAPLALLVFLGLAVLFFWRLFAGAPADRAMIGPADGDFLRQFYPYRAFVAATWAHGLPPLWNPHQYAGTPALADPQQAVLYPFRLLQVPFALGGRALPLALVELEALVHLALGAWFLFLLLRRLGAGAIPAAFGALCFGFGGYLTGYPVEQLAVLDTAVWIPALLWALTGALAASSRAPGRRGLRPALLAAAATALAILAGHPQTALYLLWAGLAWFGWRLWVERPGAQAALAALVLWLGGAALLAAAQWLPAWSFARRAARVLDPAEVAAGLPLVDLIQVLAPGVVSHYSPLYVGVLAWPFVLWGGRRLRATRFWLGLAAFGWLLALGGNQPLFPWLLRILPGLGWFRHQERAAVLVSLGLAVAAGLALGAVLASIRPGADGALGAPEPAKAPPDGHRPARATARLAAALALVLGLAAALAALRPALPGPLSGWDAAALADALAFSALISGLGAGILALLAAGRLGARGAGLGLLALAAFELFSVNRGVVLYPREAVFASDPALAALLPRAREGRVSSEARLPGGANAASVHGLYDVTGDSPLALGATVGLMAEAPEILWWRLLGVRFVLSDRPADAAPWVEIARGPEAGLYELQLPVPPAWVPRGLRCQPGLRRLVEGGARGAPGGGDGQAGGAATTSGGEAGAGGLPDPAGPWAWAGADLDPQAVLVLDPLDAGADCAAAALAGGSAELVALGPLRVAVRAELPEGGWLALALPYEPGWRARARAADGRQLRPAVVPAYGAIQALRLPAGSWTIEWTYAPNAAIVGGLASLFALGLGVLLWRSSGGRP